jgi:hypothetical protein
LDCCIGLCSQKNKKNKKVVIVDIVDIVVVAVVVLMVLSVVDFVLLGVSRSSREPIIEDLYSVLRIITQRHNNNYYNIFCVLDHRIYSKSIIFLFTSKD